MNTKIKDINYKLIYLLVSIYPLIDIFYVLNEEYFKIQLPINQFIRGLVLLFLLKEVLKYKEIYIIGIIAVILAVNEVIYLYIFNKNTVLITDVGYILKIILFITTIYSFKNMMKSGKIKFSMVLKFISYSSLIISCNILLATYFGLGLASYFGESVRNGYKGYFLTVNMVVAFLTIMTPIVLATYIQCKKIRFLIFYLVNIFSLMCVGSKFGALSSIIMICALIVFIILKYYKKECFKKIGLILVISVIILLILFSKNITNFINVLIIQYNEVEYSSIFNFLLSNRNLQILYLDKFISNMGWIINPILLFGLGFSNANTIVEYGKSDFKIIEMDFHGLLYYSGIICTLIIIYIIVRRIYNLIKYYLNNINDYIIVCILLSLFLTLIQSILGGHVIYEAGPAFYFAIVLSISEYIVVNRYTTICKKYKETKSLKLENEPKIGIVIVNYNGESFNEDCLNSIFNSKYTNYEIIVVDNASKDNSVEILKNKYFKRVKLIELDENLGFSMANNIGINYAIENRFDYVLLLNNDTIINDDMILTMVKASENGKYVISPKIYYYDNKQLIWSAGGTIEWDKGITIQYGMDQKDSDVTEKKCEVNFATGCCMLIPTDIIKKVGLLSDEYFLYYEDTDYCVRICKAGYKIIYEPEAVMYHRVSAATGGKKSRLYVYYMIRNRLIFNKKFNKINIIANIYFYVTTFIKLIINKVKKEDFVIEETKNAIRDYKKGINGKINRF